MFDILITVALKDYNKLPFIMESVRNHIKGYGDIYVISPNDIPNDYVSADAHYLLDRDIADFDLSRIEPYRQGWYKQQFIKMFQNETADDYLVVDADVWINKNFDINPDHPTFFLGRNQDHQPYFKLMKAVLDLDKVYPHSFICEMMFFKRDIIWEILKYNKRNKKSFVARCVDEIIKNGHPSGFSEYETYGNFVTKYYPELYNYKKINVLHNKKLRMWTTQELKVLVGSHGNNGYDILTMHSYV